MIIAITGSLGYIGTVVTKYFLDKYPDLDFVLIDRGFTDISLQEKYESDNVVIYSEMSRTKNESIDVLIHLAAHSSVPESNVAPEEYFQNNCTELSEFLTNNRVDKIIYASSFGVYDEEMNVAPRSIYGVTKLAGEHICNIRHETVSLRFSNPVGIVTEHFNRHVSQVMNHKTQLLNNLARPNRPFKLHSNSHMYRDFFPVKWIANVIDYSFIEILCDKFTPSIINVSSGKLLNVNDVTLKIIEENNIEYETVEPPVGTVVGGSQLNGLSDLGSMEIEGFDDYDPEKYLLDSFNGYLAIMDDL